MWTFNGAVIPNIGLNAVAGRPKEEYGIEPTAFDGDAARVLDIDERIKDMNAGGVLGSMCFPSFPGFAAASSPPPRTRTSRSRCSRPTTTGTSTTWCGSCPGRFIPMGLPVLWDAELAAAEVRRLAKKGVHSLTFTENPADPRLPELPLRPLGSAVDGAVPTRAWCSRSTSARRASWR